MKNVNESLEFLIQEKVHMLVIKQANIISDTMVLTGIYSILDTTHPLAYQLLFITIYGA